MEAAENLKITAENLNSMLTTSFRKISDTRKRTKKLKAVSILRRRRKKKESKLEIPSEFKKSTKRINNILPRGLGQNMMTSIVELISLLLVGVAVNNIGELKEKIDKLKGGFDKNMKFLKGIVDSVYQGTRGFISLFESEDREKQLKDAEEQAEKLKNTEKDQLEIQKLLEKLRTEYELVEKRFKNAESGAGINLDRVIIDPGFGFGKTAEQNFELLARLEVLCNQGQPVLVGLSRKSMISSVLDRPPERRMVASVALALMAVERGARIVRVHDVAATFDALSMWQTTRHVLSQSQPL